MTQQVPLPETVKDSRVSWYGYRRLFGHHMTEPVPLPETAKDSRVSWYGSRRLFGHHMTERFCYGKAGESVRSERIVSAAHLRRFPAGFCLRSVRKSSPYGGRKSEAGTRGIDEKRRTARCLYETAGRRSGGTGERNGKKQDEVPQGRVQENETDRIRKDQAS